MSIPTPRSRGLLLALACMAQFMVVLDVAIVNVALPSIQSELEIEQGVLQWVVIAYGLLLGGFLLLGGRLTDFLGRRRILIVGLALFTLASLAAGLAGSAETLIGARAVQGFGAALIPPAALSIVAVTFEEGEARNRALGLFGAVTGVSASIGVIASGLLTDGPGWRSIFLINVPIGVVLIVLALVGLPAEAGARRAGARFDVAGAVTVTGGLLAIIFGLNRAADSGWASSWAWAPLVAGVVLLAAFVLIEKRSRDPLLPGVALRNRTLVAANVSAFFTFGAFFSFIFLGSLFMQQVLDYSPTQAGIAWLATTVISFVAAAVTGSKLVGVVGVRVLLVVGQALLAAAVLLLTSVSADAVYAFNLLPAFVLAGLAGGIAAPAAQIGALSNVSPSLTGLASGLVETMRELGGAIGVAVVASLLIATATGVDGFRAGFWGIFVTAAVGAIASAIAFPTPGRRARVEAAPSSVSNVN